MRVVIGIVVLAAGIAVFAALKATKPEAQKSERFNRGTPVEVLTLGKSAEHIVVRARGTVVPARQVVLGPEVGGKVVGISERFVPGGRFGADELMVRINPADYRLAVDSQFAAVDSAQTQLTIEKGRKKIAEREWELFKGKDQADGASLALREPQLRTAEVAVKAAESGLKRARLNVARTQIRAPFNGTVQQRHVELGQMVAPGAPLATFVGSDAYWVQLSVPVEQLRWFDTPEVGGATTGSAAQVVQRMGDQEIRRQGRITRLLADVDPAGRMARLLVEIDDPLGLSDGQAGADLGSDGAGMQLPLLLGSFVDVEIQGHEAKDVFEIPRIALRSEDTVYVMTDEGRLAVRRVVVVWRRENTVLVGSGLAESDRVIVSPVPAAVEGMKLRLTGSSEPDDEAARDAKAAQATGRPQEAAN